MTEEYLDVVSEDNQVVGQERRPIIHRSGLWHRGVHVFLFTSDRKLLVQQRSQAQDTYPNALDCSVSEHLRVGESYLDGAIRGLREELGLPPIPLRRLVQFRMNYGPGDNMINELYEGVCNSNLLTIDRKEIEQIAYHTIPELEEMIALERIPFASWFVQLLRWYTGKPAVIQVFWALSWPNNTSVRRSAIQNR